MSVLLQIIGDWGHALAAMLFAALGIFLLRRRDSAAEIRSLAAALLLRLVALDVPPAELRRRRRDEGEQQERGAQHDVACDSH